MYMQFFVYNETAFVKYKGIMSPSTNKHVHCWKQINHRHNNKFQKEKKNKKTMIWFQIQENCVYIQNVYRTKGRVFLVLYQEVYFVV